MKYDLNFDKTEPLHRLDLYTPARVYTTTYRSYTPAQQMGMRLRQSILNSIKADTDRMIRELHQEIYEGLNRWQRTRN